MRSKSKKRAKADRQSRDALREFAAEFPFCWCCGEAFGAQTHHIGGREHPRRHDRANLARLCGGPGTNDCHRLIHSGAIRNPLRFCLALKQLFDLPHYDRSLVLKIDGKADSFVTETEVLAVTVG